MLEEKVLEAGVRLGRGLGLLPPFAFVCRAGGACAADVKFRRVRLSFEDSFAVGDQQSRLLSQYDARGWTRCDDVWWWLASDCLEAQEHDHGRVS